MTAREMDIQGTTGADPNSAITYKDIILKLFQKELQKRKLRNDIISLNAWEAVKKSYKTPWCEPPLHERNRLRKASEHACKVYTTRIFNDGMFLKNDAQIEYNAFREAFIILKENEDPESQEGIVAKKAAKSIHKAHLEMADLLEKEMREKEYDKVVSVEGYKRLGKDGSRNI